MIIAFQDEHRSIMLLALAELALRRPGWDMICGQIADDLKGREMYDGFKITSADIVVPK